MAAWLAGSQRQQLQRRRPRAPHTNQPPHQCFKYEHNRFVICSLDIDIALDNMLGREFADRINEYLKAHVRRVCGWLGGWAGGQCTAAGEGDGPC